MINTTNQDLPETSNNTNAFLIFATIAVIALLFWFYSNTNSYRSTNTNSNNPSPSTQGNVTPSMSPTTSPTTSPSPMNVIPSQIDINIKNASDSAE